jgi:superfamily II DNA or RNA helicase
MRPWLIDTSAWAPPTLKILAGLLPFVWPDFDWPKVLNRDVKSAIDQLIQWGWRDYQAEAVSAALHAPLGRCVLDVGTGGGKTRIAWGIAFASDVQPWLYVVYGRDLVRQSRDAFTGLSAAHAQGSDVQLDCVGWNDMRIRAAGYAGVIVDECHGAAARTRAHALASFKGGWRIGLSGTPLDRTDARNAMIIGLLGPVAYRIGVDDLVADGHLTPGKVVVVPFPSI